MSYAYLSLGSNLGDKKCHLDAAMEEIERLCGKIISCSSLYATAPWGFDSKNEFFNLVLKINTFLSPQSLLLTSQEIERGIGRQQKTDSAYHDRVVDIDLLFYDNLMIETESLTLPHPRLHLRRFVLVPLAEIEPFLIHPVLKINIIQLLSNCTDSLSCAKL